MEEGHGSPTKSVATNPRAFLDIRVDDVPIGQMIFELRRDLASKTCANFMALCTGEAGLSASGFELTYKNCKFHRIAPNEVCQSGDFTIGDGTGGESVFGADGFEDETFALNHAGAGVLSMVNAGPDTNRSQFFITFARMPSLDNAHVVFGFLVEGLDVLRKIESYGSPSGQPLKEVTISRCGIISEYG